MRIPEQITHGRHQCSRGASCFWEAAAELAALAAWRTVAAHDRVGAIVFNDLERVEIRPKRTQATVMRILRTIERQNQALRADSLTRSNPGMLNEVLRLAARLATHDFLVIVVSDAIGADSESAKLLTTIARHNDVLITLVVDPLETDLPNAGDLMVSDEHRQMEIATGDSSLRSRFHRSFADHLASARRFLLTRDVPVLLIQTDSDVTDQVVRALGGRRGANHA